MERLGRYELLLRLSSDSLTTVYAARVSGAAGFDKLVALTVSHARSEADPVMRDEFLKEARTAAHVRSPFVVSTFDLGETTEGTLYTVTDLVLGCSLLDLLHERGSQGLKPPESALVAEIVRQAALGLNDYHAATSSTGDPLLLVHRDVRPSNLLIGLDGSTRLALTHTTERMRASQQTDLDAAFAYRAPEELAEGKRHPAADIFALGVVLFEALTLERLFARETANETIRAVAAGAHAAIARVAPTISDELIGVLTRALDPDPARRFDTALEFADALRNASASASPHALRELVEQTSGEETAALVAQIRQALEQSTAPADMAGPEPAVDRETLATKTLTLHAAQLGVAMPPPTLVRAAVSQRTPPRTSRAWWIVSGALAVVLLLLAGVFTWLIASQNRELARADAAVSSAGEPAAASIDAPQPSAEPAIEGVETERNDYDILAEPAFDETERAPTPISSAQTAHNMGPRPPSTPVSDMATEPAMSEQSEHSGQPEPAPSPHRVQTAATTGWTTHLSPAGHFVGWIEAQRLAQQNQQRFSRCWAALHVPAARADRVEVTLPLGRPANVELLRGTERAVVACYRELFAGRVRRTAGGPLLIRVLSPPD